MSTISANIGIISSQLPAGVKLIAVSKTKSADLIREAYNAGQRAFAENYVQELIEKKDLLPDDIEWHFIGHLQSNKVKYIAPFVHWIHSVDSESLLKEINKQAARNNRIIQVLLQVHIAKEETKFGLNPEELRSLALSIQGSFLPNVAVRGLMGMASFSDDMDLVRSEFRLLKMLFEELKNGIFASDAGFNQLSMGMSSDWPLAVEEGSTMIRVGSSIFGGR